MTARREARALEAATKPFDWDAWNADMDARADAAQAALARWNETCTALVNLHMDTITGLRADIAAIGGEL